MPTAPLKNMMYDTLAAYYDALVGDPEATEDWVDWVESWKPGRDFLELACGTGEITGKLAENHHVDALDLAPHMVETAKKKFPDISFEVRDMRDLSGYGLYDAVGCFCDSFNYLTEEADVKAFFDEAASHLKDGGLFFFDTHSQDRIGEFAEGYEEAGSFEDGTDVQWEISTTPEGLLYQDFAFYQPEQTMTEHHIQRVYDPAWLSSLLEKDFDILDIRTDFTEPGVVEGEKIFFVCRRKKRPEGSRSENQTEDKETEDKE